MKPITTQHRVAAVLFTLATVGPMVISACYDPAVAPPANTIQTAPRHPHTLDEAYPMPDPKTGKVKLSDDQWRERLTPDQFNVLREKGTERPFTGAYHKTKTPGMYICAACGLDLYPSDTKFDSGTGWPSFYAPASGGVVETVQDRSFGMARDELVCARCGSHLGHVFNDGPAPTGQRHCINSASLKLVPKDAPDKT